MATMICRDLRALLEILAHFRRIFAVISLLIVVATLPACSKSGAGKTISSTSFDSAPADVKKMWTDSMAAWKSHRYEEAATSFASLENTATNLSPQQKDDLTRAVDEFGQEAFAAANKGDAEATKAVQTLRGASGRRSGGR
jgi:hypothetical protein